MQKNHVALITIDIQQGFHDVSWGKRNNLSAEENMEKILSTFRSFQKPIFHVQHLSTMPTSPLMAAKSGVEFMPFLTPKKNERVFQKNVNSAFIGTDLHAILQQHDIEALVFIGISTDHCVSTSVRMAANLGFKAIVVSDATFTFERSGYNGVSYPAELVHDLALASLHQEFATVCDTETIIDEICASHAS